MHRGLHDILLNTKSTKADRRTVPGNSSVIANSCYTVTLLGVIHCFQQKLWCHDWHSLVIACFNLGGLGWSWLHKDWKGRDVVFPKKPRESFLNRGKEVHFNALLSALLPFPWHTLMLGLPCCLCQDTTEYLSSAFSSSLSPIWHRWQYKITF